MKRIIIADDHKLFGGAVAFLLSQLDPELEVLTGSSVADVLNHLEKGISADLILLDYDMPVVNGISGMAMIWKKQPDANIAIISGHAPPNLVKVAIDQGAKGWLQKSLSEDQLLHALRMMAMGGVYVPVDVLAAVQVHEQRWGHLTPAESNVTRLVADGLSDKEIAMELSVAPKTVQMHMRKILSKVGLDNRTKLALAYIRENEHRPLTV